MMMTALSSRARSFGECSTVHSPPALFCFFKVDFRSRTLNPLFRPGSVHSSSAKLDESGRVFPDELRVSLSPGRFPRYAWVMCSYVRPRLVSEGTGGLRRL